MNYKILLYTLQLFILCFCISQAQEFEVDQNTIALWHFNEGSGNIFYDETAYANDGDIIDGTWTGVGYFAGAIDYDGIDDYLTVPMSSSLTSLTNQATIEMYFKYTGTVDTSYELWRYGTDTNHMTSSAKIETGNKQLRAAYVSNGQVLGGVALESINPLVENQWYHVALCYDGSKSQLFIDGILQDEVAATEVLDVPNDRFWIGRNGFATIPRYFEGIIDEIRISNIARYSTSQPFEVDQNTIALWHFNEGSGNIFYDETSYANDGDIIDGTWTTEGYFAGAIDFDGIDDYLTVPMSSSLTSLTNQATIEMFFKYTGPVNSSYCLWRYGTAVINSSAKIGTGTKKLYASYVSNGQGLGGVQLESINPLVENQWYHIALCYDGSKEQLFINGELQDEVASTDILDTPDDRFWFGRNGYATNPKYYNGIIDEIRISNIDRYSTTGVEENGNGFPTDFKLSQNYPNPFNPTTKIRYEIPEVSFVTIKVYDVLGSEITTLVSEEKPVGRYEVEFDAITLPSGIYFYRLQAGSFVETKKMILLK